MANFIFNQFKLHVGNDTIDLDGDVFKCALLTDSHVPSAGYERFAEVSSTEVSGSGYTAGGITLTNVTWAIVNDASYFDSDDPLWTNATFTARYAVIYDDTTTFPADVLMFFYDFEANQLINNGSLRLRLDSRGFARIS